LIASCADLQRIMLTVRMQDDLAPHTPRACSGIPCANQLATELLATMYRATGFVGAR
jgi:hypothetical protein